MSEAKVFDRAPVCVSASALFDGVISCNQEIDSILSHTGRAILTNAQCGSNKVELTGEIVFSVIFVNTNGETDCMSSSSAFTHTVDAPCTSQSRVMARLTLNKTSAHAENGITVSGTVDISLAIFDPQMINIPSTDGLIVKKANIETANIVSIRRIDVRVKDEKRMAQTQSAVKKVCSASGCAMVSASREEDKAVVTGELMLKLVYLCDDTQSPISHASFSLEVAEMMPLSAAEQSCEMMLDACPGKIEVYLTDDPDVLDISATITLSLIFYKRSACALPAAAYSTKTVVDCMTSDVCFLSNMSSLCESALTRHTLSLGEPRATRVINVSAAALVKDAMCADGMVTVSGMIRYNVCYATQQGMRSKSIDVAFKTDISASCTSGMKAWATVCVKNVMTEGVGSDIGAAATLSLNIMLITENCVNMVSEITDTHVTPQRKGGITVYFASGGESIWDVARTFCCDMDALMKLNSVTENQCLTKGQKLLVM